MIPIMVVLIVLGTVANIDNTAPTITNIEATASENEASVTITLKASDAQSGIKTINWQYQKNHESWQSAPEDVQISSVDDKQTGQRNGPFTHEFKNLEENTDYRFKASVTDVATNKSQESDTKTAHTTTTAITPTTEIIGDYVDYPIDINGNDTTTDDWRIFYVGQDGDGEAKGRIFLIAADYVAHTCAELDGALSASGMTSYRTTDPDWETYHWWPIPEYHCNDGHNNGLNNSKVQCSFPELFMPENEYCKGGKRLFCSDHTSYANSQCASRLQCTEDWKTFAKADLADCAIGGPTLNMWVESWNSQHGTEKELYAIGRGNDHGYYVGEYDTATTTSVRLSDCDGYDDTIYFPHKSPTSDLDGDRCDEWCYGYWLASPSAYTLYRAIQYDSYVNYGGLVDAQDVTNRGVRDPPCSLSKT